MTDHARMFERAPEQATVMVRLHIGGTDHRPVADAGVGDRQMTAAGRMGDAEKQRTGLARRRRDKTFGGGGAADDAAERDIRTALRNPRIFAIQVYQRFRDLKLGCRHGLFGAIDIVGAEQVVMQTAADLAPVEGSISICGAG